MVKRLSDVDQSDNNLVNVPTPIGAGDAVNKTYADLKVAKDELVYNAKDHSALGNGSTDDQPALQALVDAVSMAGGGTIYLPNGIYRLNAPITWKSNVSLIGAGVGKSVLAPNDGGTGTRISAISYIQEEVSEATPIANCTFADFEIDGTNQTNTAYSHSKGIYIQYMRNCTLRDLFVHDTIATGIGIDYLDKVVIDHVNVTNCGKSWTTGLLGGSGIGIGTGGMAEENCIITNCNVVNSGQYGIFFEDQAIVGSPRGIYPSRGVVVSNCIVRAGRNHGIGVRGSKNVSITGNQVYGCAGAGISLDGGNSTDVTITGNTITENQRGIWLQSDASYWNISVVGNNLRGQTGYQMVFEGGNIGNLNVSSNVVTDGASGGIAVENIATTARRISIRGNDVSLNGSYGIKYTTIGTYIDISDNLVTSNGNDGIYLAATQTYVTVANNKCMSNTGYGVNQAASGSIDRLLNANNYFASNSVGSFVISGSNTNYKADGVKTTDANGWTCYHQGDWKRYTKKFGPYSATSIASLGASTLATTANMPVGVAPNDVIYKYSAINDGGNSAWMVVAPDKYNESSTNTSFVYSILLRNITGATLTFSGIYFNAELLTK